MRTIENKYQQNIVEDLNKNYLSETKESYKLKTLEILENQNTTFSEFIDEQSIATDLSRLGGIKEGAMLKEQLSMLGLFNKGQEKLKAINNTLTSAPNGGKGLITKLGGPFNGKKLVA